MPLRVQECYRFYSSHLPAEEVVDEIWPGRNEYPVTELCKEQDFDAAAALLEKGYHCLHKEFVPETLAVLYSTRDIPYFLPEKDKRKIPEVLNKLSDELSELDKTVISDIAEELKYLITNERFFPVQILREHVPVLYHELLQFSHWTIEEFLYMDLPFLEDYFDEPKTQEQLPEFIHANRECTNFCHLLSELLTSDNLDCLSSHEEILYRAAAVCPDVFPESFSCDVAILASIGKLRLMINDFLFHTHSTVENQTIVKCKDFQSLIGRLNRLLRFHMKENFSFDYVAKTLLTANSLAELLDPPADPDSLDLYILSTVADFARQHFHLEKIPVQEGSLWDFTLNSKLKEHILWFHENCKVEKTNTLHKKDGTTMAIRIKPSTPLSELYLEQIHADLVTDEPLTERSHYPVVDLCLSQEYEAAFALLEKGYRCLHQDKSHETMNILRAIQLTSCPATRNTENIPNVLEQLHQDLSALDAAEFQNVINECQCILEERKFTLVPFLREKFSILYRALLRQRNWTVKQLICIDEQFLEDYLNELAAQNQLSEFIAANHITDSQAPIILQQAFDVMRPETLRSREKNVERLACTCPEIFPENFVCDAAILVCIYELRLYLDKMYEEDPFWDVTGNDALEAEPFVDYLGGVLCTYMKENYSFDHVAQTLVNLCDNYTLDYDPEEPELPHGYDFIVLNAVTTYAMELFELHKLPITEKKLDEAFNNWKKHHLGPDNTLATDQDQLIWMNIQKLVDWFKSRCKLV